MRTERPSLPFHADCLEAFRHECLNANHFLGSGFHANPEGSGRSARRERTEAAQGKFKRRMRQRFAHRIDDWRSSFFGYFTDEDQRDVELVAFCPAEG
jgi:hypothetical protein